MDFETMTSSGPSIFIGSPHGSEFDDPWGASITVVADPTPRATGHVAQIHYQMDGVSQTDDNKALFPQGFTRGAGQALWFSGMFFIPSGVDMVNVQRKLLYWKWSEFAPSHPFAMLVKAFGNQLVIDNQPAQAFTLALGTGENWFVDTGLAQLTAGVWHTLKVHLVPNTAFANADGILEVWYDGIQIFSRSDLQWADATTWSGNALSDFQFTQFGVGYQVDATEPVDELRYWDNLSFATAEASL